MDVDSRFSSSPSAAQLFAMILLSILATIVALVALHSARRHRRPPRPPVPAARWWRFTGVDGVVVGVLVLWHFIGANTSDDGYLLTMARVAEHAGYMANYFRWFGVPEAPFGWYYDVLDAVREGLHRQPVDAAARADRRHPVLAGDQPRGGARASAARCASNRIALWTGGLVFLAFWLPYNNGLRPEPIVAARRAADLVLDRAGDRDRTAAARRDRRADRRVLAGRRPDRPDLRRPR